MLLRDRPSRLLAPMRWLVLGGAAFMRELAESVELGISDLAYNRCVIDFIKGEREKGRRIVLVTANNLKLADRVAGHLGLFDEVLKIDSDSRFPKVGKGGALMEKFGHGGFDYIGSSRKDIEIWRAARHSYVANALPCVARHMQKLGNVSKVLSSEGSMVREWLKALRLHQWLKNLLVFVPLFAAHRYTELPLLRDGLIAFLCFGLCASSVYIFNDLLDLREDRQHTRKRARPFASGRLSARSGLVISPVLLLGAFAVALWRLPLAFTVGLASYYAITCAYSLALKRFMIVDVIVLAGLYTLRVIIGAISVGVPLSFWLLAFSMFVFFSLALVKRYAELYHAHAQEIAEKTAGRGYFPDDLPMVAALGAGSGYLAVMVLALYINDPRISQLYTHQELIWFACPLLLSWISRIWMLAHRGMMNDDPLDFSIRDRVSLSIGALLIVIFWAAI